MAETAVGDAFHRQIVALLPRLRRFAFGLTRSFAEADDLVQAACLRALEKRAQWTPGSRLDSWLYRIVQNLWVDHRRQVRRRGEESSDAIPEDAGELTAISTQHRGEGRLMLSAVERAILMLPDDQRAVLMLVSVDGMAYREAADALGIPIGTVMSRLARARLGLAETLSDRQPDVDVKGR